MASTLWCEKQPSRARKARAPERGIGGPAETRSSEHHSSEYEDKHAKSEGLPATFEDIAAQSEDTTAKSEDTAAKTEDTAAKFEEKAAKFEDKAAKFEDRALKLEPVCLYFGAFFTKPDHASWLSWLFWLPVPPSDSELAIEPETTRQLSLSLRGCQSRTSSISKVNRFGASWWTRFCER